MEERDEATQGLGAASAQGDGAPEPVNEPDTQTPAETPADEGEGK